jgi:hypothetical protein
MSIRELPQPIEIDGDDNATEMIRVWLANDDLCVSLLLGMYEDAESCDIDERDAWGQLLSDVIKHIANGLNQSHGWDKAATASRIRKSLLEHLKRTSGVVEGAYWED